METNVLLMLENDLKEARSEIKRLKHCIQNQELSAKDVEHMSNRRNELKHQVRQMTEKKDEIQRNIWDIEREVEQELDSVRRRYTVQPK